MTWVRIDDDTYERPELAGVSDTAVAVWLYALIWNNRQLADGALPEGILTRIIGPQRGLTADNVLAAANELVDSGAFAKDGKNYRIVLAIDLQPTRDKIQRKRANGRVRQRRWSEKRANGVSNGTTSGSGSGDDDDLYLSPDLEESSSPPTRSNGVADAVSNAVSNAYREVSGKPSVTPAIAKRLATLQEQFGADALADALGKAAEKTNPVAYAAKVLETAARPEPIHFARDAREVEIQALQRQQHMSRGAAVEAYEAGQRAERAAG